MQLRINHIHTAIYALKKDIDALYEYMTVLSTQQMNPLIMPPDILGRALDQVKDGYLLKCSTNFKVRTPLKTLRLTT